MSGPSSLPKRNKPASDPPLPNLIPVEPEHKAISLCWMWFTEQASKGINDPAGLAVLKDNALKIASEFLKLEYQLDVKAKAIRTYYDQARENAELAHVEWDEFAVAMVLRSQGSDPIPYDKFKTLLDQYDMEVSLKAEYSPFFSANGLFMFNLRPLTSGSRTQTA